MMKLIKGLKNAGRKKGPAPTAAEEPKPLPPTLPTAKSADSGKQTVTIEAKIDVGFGNALYVRGEGPGLSWDKGIMMDCVADDKWVITLSDAAKPVVFKFLLNDITWCVGNDCTVDPGASMTTVPVF